MKEDQFHISRDPQTVSSSELPKQHFLLSCPALSYASGAMIQLFTIRTHQETL